MANQKTVTPAKKVTKKTDEKSKSTLKLVGKKSAEKIEKSAGAEKKPVVRNHTIYKSFATDRAPTKTSVVFPHEPGGTDVSHGRYSSKIWRHLPTGGYICTIWKNYFVARKVVAQVVGEVWVTGDHLYGSPEEYQEALRVYCESKGLPVKDGDYIV